MGGKRTSSIVYLLEAMPSEEIDDFLAVPAAEDADAA